MRITRFIRSLWVCRRFLSRHNVRALWIQSRPGWLERNGLMADLTDEEFDAFMEAIKS